MKFNELFTLQLFAEDPEGGDGNDPNKGADPEGGAGNPGEGGEGGEGSDGSGAEKKYTDDDVNEIVKRKKAEWEKQKKKDDDEAKKFAKMNAQEKADYKQQQLEKEIQKLKDERTLSNMRDEARKQLSEKGINVSDKLLAFMVSKDAKETKEAVDSFAELFNAAVNEAVKGKARQSTPKEGGQFTSGKEKIDIGKMAREARIIK